MNKLESVIATSSQDISCEPLPLAHVTSWSNFVQIIRAGRLLSRLCPVFREELLYLSYGAVAYKPSKKAYSWADDEPVLMVFTSRTMQRVTRFFPFDTGAIAAGRFEDDYLTTINDFRSSCGIHFSTRSTPWHWISIAFGSNTQYVARKERLPLNSTEDLLMVIARMQRYYKTDERTDHRLVGIECHVKGEVPLDEVVWLGVPVVKREELTALFLRNGHRLPPVFWYADTAESGSLPCDLRSQAEKFFVAAAHNADRFLVANN